MVVASVLTKLDLNETKASPRYSIACSIIRLHKRLGHYFLGKEGNVLREKLDLTQLSETEAVIGASAQRSTLTRHENPCAGTLRVLDK